MIDVRDVLVRRMLRSQVLFRIISRNYYYCHWSFIFLVCIKNPQAIRGMIVSGDQDGLNDPLESDFG
ncbi:hypothetical protein [uncultured Shewanella sp.]|uniref:hypothetical protein n=1 Tax=uncultured Shewanella sp. TaxID=173975 RepID=UPI00261C6715|nr:hypothetical protein [uncultured Shewanella sp.]